MMKKLFRFL